MFIGKANTPIRNMGEFGKPTRPPPKVKKCLDCDTLFRGAGKRCMPHRYDHMMQVRTTMKKKYIYIPGLNAFGLKPLYIFPKGTFVIGTAKAKSFNKKK